jgi:hypothetical protein
MKRDLQIYRNEADRPHASEAMIAWLWTILFVVIVARHSYDRNSFQR